MDTFRDRDGRALELNDAKGNAADMSTRSGCFFILAFDRDLLGNGKAVGLRIGPVTSQTVWFCSPAPYFFLHAITQQAR